MRSQTQAPIENLILGIHYTFDVKIGFIDSSICVEGVLNWIYLFDL